MQRLLQTVPTIEPAETRVPAYSFRNARSKLDILALLSFEPRHLITGVRIPPSSVIGPEMIAQVVAAGDTHTTMAGRLVHPPISKLRVALAHSEAVVRESHGVSTSAFQALVEGDDARFLEIRARDLEPATLRFLRSRAKWDESDRPPLRALRVSDEN